MSFFILHDFYYGVLFLSAAFAVWNIRRSKKAFLSLSILIIITACSELMAKVISYWAAITNSVVYHIFTPLEYIIFTWIYWQLLIGKTWKTILLISCIFLCVAEVLNTIFFQPLAASNTNIMILESVFLVFFSLILFAEIKDFMPYENLLSEGVFWFNSAVLIYYAFNILVWGFHSFKIYTLENPPVIIYRINLLFSAILYIIYMYSIRLSMRNIKTLIK